MLRSKRTAQPANPVVPYVAPAWIAHYFTDGELTFGQDGPMIMDLIGLHEQLLRSASGSSYAPLFLEAASVIRSLVRDHSQTPVYRDGLDVSEETRLAVAETLRVVRDWTGSVDAVDAGRQLRQAHAWAVHVDLRISAARVTRTEPFSTPVEALSPRV